MPLPLAKSRELVLQLLFAFEMNQTEEEALIPLLMRELKTTKKSVQEALVKCRAILEKQEEIDGEISEFSTEYKLERIHRVERNLLRLGIYELLYEKSLQNQVVISEAIRLAKKFGTPSGSRFVHALLDRIIHKHCLSDDSISLPRE